MTFSDSTTQLTDEDMADTFHGDGGEEALRSGHSAADGVADAAGELEPGQTLLVEGLPNEAYHRLPVPSKSPLWDFRRHGPVWYSQRYVSRTREPFSSSALQLGSVVHAALEHGPGEYRDHLTVIPAEYLTASGGLSAGKEAKAWLADQSPDSTLASPADLAICEAILEQFFANPAARELYEQVWKHELSAIHRREDGRLIRCRFDAVTELGMVLDWKTTRDVRPLETWWKTVVEHGYAEQQVLYTDIAHAAGIGHGGMIFVVMSTTPPHQVQVVRLPDAMIRARRDWVAEVLDEIEARHETGNWMPENYGEITELRVPEWAMRGEA